MLKQVQEVIMRFLFLLLLTGWIFTACSSTKDIATKNTFVFNFEDGTYQIVSLNTSTGEGSNYLFTVMSSGNTVRTATDLDQDGSMDVVIDKQYSLDEANRIYIAGILKAKAAGNFKELQTSRTYEYISSDSLFTVRSYTMNNGSVNNLFSIQLLNRPGESMYTDTAADGTLDRVDKGDIPLTEAGPLYLNTLQQGMLIQRITFIDGVYMVNRSDKTATPSPASSSDR